MQKLIGNPKRIRGIPESHMHIPMFSAQDAARLLEMDDSSVRYQIKHGKFNARKIAGVWVITPAEILRYAREVRRYPCSR